MSVGRTRVRDEFLRVSGGVFGDGGELGVKNAGVRKLRCVALRR